jgi:hypothetical protein
MSAELQTKTESLARSAKTGFVKGGETVSNPATRKPVLAAQVHLDGTREDAMRQGGVREAPKEDAASSGGRSLFAMGALAFLFVFFLVPR